MAIKVLVLGKTGCLGTSLEKVFNSNPGILHQGLDHKDFEITKIVELEDTLKSFRPDYIINTVALIGVNICEEDPSHTLNVNSVAVDKLSKMCRNNGVKLIQASTHAVFDGHSDKSYCEMDTPNPINLYGYSKLLAEYFVKKNMTDYYILRFPTMFGPRRNYSLGFVDKMLERMKSGKQIKVSVDRIDSPTYSINVASKISDIITNSYEFGTYHITDSGRTSYYEFVLELARQVGFRGKVEKAREADFPALAPNPLKVALDSQKNTLTGYSWQKSLTMYVGDEEISC